MGGLRFPVLCNRHFKLLTGRLSEIIAAGPLSMFDNLDPPMPSSATDCMPGTREKVEVMRDRFARGVAIHHPDDMKMDHPEVVRVPILSPGNFRAIGWDVMDEEEYHEANPSPPWWGTGWMNQDDYDEDGIEEEEW